MANTQVTLSIIFSADVCLSVADFKIGPFCPSAARRIDGQWQFEVILSDLLALKLYLAYFDYEVEKVSFYFDTQSAQAEELSGHMGWVNFVNNFEGYTMCYKSITGYYCTDFTWMTVETTSLDELKQWLGDMIF